MSKLTPTAEEVQALRDQVGPGLRRDDQPAQVQGVRWA